MSRSLRLRDGDLDIQGSVCAVVSGTEKLLQDLDAWLREEYRVDRFHPRYGSVLERYIGQTVSTQAMADLQTECIRVLNNYQQIQLQNFQDHPERFTANELLDEIVSVNARMSYDTVFLDITIMTADRATYRLETRIGV